MHIGDVANVDDRAVDLLHRQIVDSVEDNRAGIERNVPVELADLGVAGGQHQVLRRDGIDDVVGRYVVCLHGPLVEIDLGLQNLAAIRGRHGGAGHGGKLRTDEILPEIEQLHFRQLLARQRQLQDRHRGGVVAEHVGRSDPRRQQLEHRLRSRSHLRQSRADVYAFLKEDFHHAVA